MKPEANTLDNRLADESTDPTPFMSKLSEGRQRFLAHMIDHALACGRRTPEAFIQRFPPSVIMAGLKNQPRLRAQILVLTTGLKEKIALKKTAEAAAEDLQIALEEGETDAESVVALFAPDDRVRYLDPQELWAFLVQGDFWTVNPTQKEEFERAKEHVAFMLDRALADKLMTHRDLIDGITVSELVTRLPKGELGKIIEGALANAQRNAPFTETDLLASMPPSTLVRYVPLPHIWNTAIVPKVAEAHGYAPPLKSTPLPDPERSAETRSEEDAPRSKEAAPEAKVVPIAAARADAR
jgi:hypothetical protein